MPMMAMRFAFDGGSSQDPDGKEGLANFVTAMLDEGAGELSSREFQEREEDLSMRMSYEEAKQQPGALRSGRGPQGPDGVRIGIGERLIATRLLAQPLTYDTRLAALGGSKHAPAFHTGYGSAGKLQRRYLLVFRSYSTAEPCRCRSCRS